MAPRESIRFVTSSSVWPAVLRSISQPITLDDLPRLYYTREGRFRTHSTGMSPRVGYETRGIDTSGRRSVAPSRANSTHRIVERVKPYPVSPLLKTASGGGYESREAKREDLKFIVDSELRERMLRSSSLPASSSPLSDQYETSAPTAYRIRRSVELEGWFEKRRNAYRGLPPVIAP
jgi:hypothetical protein